VVAQTLLRRKGGGRVAALEVLVVNMAVSNLIREGKTFQIPTVMQTAKTQGMQTLNDALLDLVKAGVVEPQEAYDRSYDKKEFALLLSRTGIRAGWRELVETNTAMAPVKLG
jgi:twitching motility protein PilT